MDDFGFDLFPFDFQSADYKYDYNGDGPDMDDKLLFQSADFQLPFEDVQPLYDTLEMDISGFDFSTDGPTVDDDEIAILPPDEPLLVDELPVEELSTEELSVEELSAEEQSVEVLSVDEPMNVEVQNILNVVENEQVVITDTLTTNQLEEGEDEFVDVETVDQDGVFPVLEAGDMGSLLDQFEANYPTENKPVKQKNPPPRKRAVCVIPPMVHKSNNITQAGPMLYRQKLLKLVKLGGASDGHELVTKSDVKKNNNNNMKEIVKLKPEIDGQNSIHQEHDYCTSPDPHIKRECVSPVYTRLPDYYMTLPKANDICWDSTRTKLEDISVVSKDSGLESMEGSENEELKTPTYNRLPPYLIDQSLAKENKVVAMCQPLPPIQPTAKQEPASPVETPPCPPVKRKMNLEEYRLRRQRLSRESTASPNIIVVTPQEKTPILPVAKETNVEKQEKSVSETSSSQSAIGSTSSEPSNKKTYRRDRNSRSRSRHRGSRKRSRSRSRHRHRSRSRSRRRRSRGRSQSRSYHNRRYNSTDSSSRSRSRSPNYQRMRRRNDFQGNRNVMNRNVREMEVEERRVIYVGKIEEGITSSGLRKKFNVFGKIDDVSLHFRERGDNYGFVTFRDKGDAYEAVERGKEVRELRHYDLCFGGRRTFCKERYADLDGLTSIMESQPYHRQTNTAGPADFDTLLQEMMARRKIT